MRSDAISLSRFRTLLAPEFSSNPTELSLTPRRHKRQLTFRQPLRAKPPAPLGPCPLFAGFYRCLLLFPVVPFQPQSVSLTLPTHSSAIPPVDILLGVSA